MSSSGRQVAEGFDEALVKGIELFNQQEFYEAHEVWESAWAGELSNDRRLLQGLIQAAAGFYKLQTGAPNGTAKLLESSLTRLRPFVGKARGVELEKLLPLLEAWRDEAKAMLEAKRVDFNPQHLPRIVHHTMH